MLGSEKTGNFDPQVYSELFLPAFQRLRKLAFLCMKSLWQSHWGKMSCSPQDTPQPLPVATRPIARVKYHHATGGRNTLWPRRRQFTSKELKDFLNM